MKSTSVSSLASDKRTVFVGDIHGCFQEFLELLEKIHYKPEEDRLISLGDLVNKGPESAAVLDYFIENKIEAVMGNHDEWLWRALKGKSEMYEDAEIILRDSQFSRDELITWLEGMPLYIKDDHFIAVHAGLSPYCKLKKNKPRDLYTMRYVDMNSQEVMAKNNGSNSLVSWYEEYSYLKSGKREIIHGHWAKKKVCEYGRITGIDTGCVYGGHLTAYLMPSRCFVQVKSHQAKQFNY